MLGNGTEMNGPKIEAAVTQVGGGGAGDRRHHG